MSIQAQRRRAGEIEAIGKDRELTCAELDQYADLAQLSLDRKKRAIEKEVLGYKRYGSAKVCKHDPV